MPSKPQPQMENTNDDQNDDIDLLRAPVPEGAHDSAESETPPVPDTVRKPLNLPDKFWDAKKGEVRLDSLIKSYLHLEQKLSQTLPLPQSPEDKQRIYKLLGQPETPDGYAVDCSHGLFDADPELNKKLFDLGFTPEQLQAVYDTAAEKLVPLVLEVASEFQADRELDRLIAHFGGADKWREVSRQLLTFGRKQLTPDVLKGLSSSYEGVLALYRMMQSDGAGLAPTGSVKTAGLDETSVKALMRDPKYWRDRDPALVSKVAAAFEDMYSEK